MIAHEEVLLVVRGESAAGAAKMSVPECSSESISQVAIAIVMLRPAAKLPPLPVPVPVPTVAEVIVLAGSLFREASKLIEDWILEPCSAKAHTRWH